MRTFTSFGHSWMKYSALKISSPALQRKNPVVQLVFTSAVWPIMSLFYARAFERLKYRQLYKLKRLGGDGADKYNRIRLSDLSRRQPDHGE